MSNIEISIIIINYNTTELTIQCIKSIFEHEAQYADDIIVLDNASTDEDTKKISDDYPNITFIQSEKNLGFGAGNNKAIKQAKGEYLILLNSDTIITEPFINELLKFVKNKNNAGVVAPRLYNIDDTIQESVFKFPTPSRAFFESFFLTSTFYFLPFIGDYRKFKYNKTKKVDFVIGACFIIKKELFEIANGFDKNFFMYSEETDLMLRLKKLGKNNYFLPIGNIVHLGGASNNNTFKPVFFESQIYYFEKNFGWLGTKFFLISKIIGFYIRIVVFKLLNKKEKLEFISNVRKLYEQNLF